MSQEIPVFRTGIGQNSRRFLPSDSTKPCVIGGVIFDKVPGLDSESDGDVVMHAICNAITSISSVPILWGLARDLCKKDGITDSTVYVEKAVETLKDQKIVHVSISIEAKQPEVEGRLGEMKETVARALGVEPSQVGITAISGDGLTDFGCGDGIQCFACVTVRSK